MQNSCSELPLHQRAIVPSDPKVCDQRLKWKEIAAYLPNPSLHAYLYKQLDHSALPEQIEKRRSARAMATELVICDIFRISQPYGDTLCELEPHYQR